MDLELYEDQTIAKDLRTKVGIKRGIAQRVVGDVGHWAKKTKHWHKQSRRGREGVVCYYITII